MKRLLDTNAYVALRRESFPSETKSCMIKDDKYDVSLAENPPWIMMNLSPR